MNRFVKQDSSVLLDSNFLFEYSGRPIVIDKRFANLLHISLNNDTLCLSKDQRIDYSLLAIMNRKERTIRFGIIDYLQTYTIERFMESNFKLIKNLGKRPTIIEPNAYKERFRLFHQLHWIGACEQ